MPECDIALTLNREEHDGSDLINKPTGCDPEVHPSPSTGRTLG